jgi:holliday junction DNA helicase RuvB
MKITIDLIHGLPKKELLERIHFHNRQGEISDRALGFYLLELEKTKQFRPFKNAAEWARKHLPGLRRPDKLILLARGLEKLPEIESAFHQGEVPWTKIREIARIATPQTEGVWLKAARELSSRDLEEEVRQKKRGDRPGGGLKARRTFVEAKFRFTPEEWAFWGKAFRKIKGEIPGASPGRAILELSKNTLRTDPEGNLPGRRRHGRPAEQVVYHLGRKESWIDGEEGRISIEPEVVQEKVRSGVPVIEVSDIEGAGVSSAIEFGERGKVAKEDRDPPVSGELKAAVLARDGRCLVCGAVEDLSPHHLDSHADGGKSDMTRLCTLCAVCQGLVHDQEIILRVEEDGTVMALDREGKEIAKARSAAEVLAEADQSTPLETIARSGTAGPEAAPESAPPEEISLDSLDDLPSELTAAQWNALEEMMEWSPAHRAFLFRPDGRSLVEILNSLPAPEARSAEAAVSPTPLGERPGSFADFSGQRRVVENLLLAARAAMGRAESPGHVLLSGQPGLGKTSVARLLARECGSGLVEVLAGNIADPSQLLSLLSRLPRAGFILVDEIHNLAKACEEFLYGALEDRVVEAVLREGGRTRAVKIRLEPFTLVGATTRLGELSEPFRSRFRLRERLEPYGEEELSEVVVKAAARLGTSASAEAAREVARRSKGTPREAIRILERARDVAQVSAAQGIGLVHVDHAAERLGIDERGLDRVDRKALKLLLVRGRPMGIGAIASRLGMDLETFRDVHEPWLERSGLIERTEWGRIATEEARKLYGEAAILSPKIGSLP